MDSNWLTPGNWRTVPPGGGPPSGGAGNNAYVQGAQPHSPTISANVPAVENYLIHFGAITQTAGIAPLSGMLRMGFRSDLTGDVGGYNLSGGTLQAISYRITEGANQVATVNVSGGTFLQVDGDPANGNQWARFGAHGTANVNLSGTGLMSFDGRVLLGDGTGSATVTQTGGTFEVRRGELVIGNEFNAMSPTPNVNYNISGGTLRAISSINDDDQGGNITVGQWGNANARLAISGTATVRANRDIRIADVDPALAGAGNRGEIVQSGGAVTYGRGFIAGRARSGANLGQGAYTLSGGSLTQDPVADLNDGASWNHIGQAGQGTFNLSGGTVSFDSRTHLGNAAGSSGGVMQTGGVFEVRRSDLIIGDNGRASYSITAGTLRTLNGGQINVGHFNNSDGALSVSGTAQVIVAGDMNVGNADVNPRGTVNQIGGRVTINGNLQLANVPTGTADYFFQGGVLDMTGGSILVGPGRGAFHFLDGRLEDVAVVRTVLLRQISGTLAPGTSGATGTTTFDNTYYALLLAATVELNIEVASFDQLISTAQDRFQYPAVSLDGNLDLIAGAGLAAGQTFRIIDTASGGSVLGTFRDKIDNVPFLEDGATWVINYQGGDGNDVVLTHIIPEPGSVGLLGLAFCGLLIRCRRR